MSSLTRARSLRQPAGPTALPPTQRAKESNQDPNRNISPSRLPTKPATRRPPGSTATGPARSTSGRLNRPGSASSNASSSAPTATAAPRRSMSLGKKPTGTARAAQEPAETTTTTTTTRKDPSRYPPLSSNNRPQSMIMRPTSAGSTGSAAASTGLRRTTPTHARANSSAVPASGSTTTRGSATTTLDRKSRSRPPSRDQTSTVTAPSTNGTTPGTPKRRAVSADKAPTTPTAAAGPGNRLNRPALNNLQQRFSPSKTNSPKPSTPYARPASPSKLPANIAASAETSRLQAELLQLHLLHRDACKVEAEWQNSAKAQLGQRFRKLRDAHRALLDMENAEVESDNVAALQRWAAAPNGNGGRGTGSGLDIKIQALDDVVSGVWMLSEPNGKYARVVRRFERWIERVLDLEEARENGTIGLTGGSIGGRGSYSLGTSGIEETLFIQDMDPAWGEDCAGMARRLESWQAQLEDAGYHYSAAEASEKARQRPQHSRTRSNNGGVGLSATAGGAGGSSVERMLEGTGALIEDMLAELSAMEEIRQGALAREEEWIEAMNRDDDENDTPPAGAIWRAV